MSSITPKKLLQFLEKMGFYIARQNGSHMILHHNNDTTRRVTLPIHNKDLKQGTLNSIFKQAGIDKKKLFNKK